jgi:hypothetical protein
MGLFDFVGDILGINPEASTRNFQNELNESVEGLAGVRPKILEYNQRDRPQFNAFERESLFSSLLGDNYAPGIIDLMSQSSGRMRGNELDQIGQYAPQAQSALRALDPGSQSILDTLISQTQGNLDRGGASALDQQRVREATRSAQAVRGQGYSPRDSMQEAVNLLVNDEQAQMRRRAEASSILSTIAMNRTNPLMQLLMGGSQFNSGPMMNLAAGINSTSTLPLDPYANKDVADFNANAINAANIAKANNAGALTGTVVGGMFDLAGAGKVAGAMGSGSQSAGGKSLFSFLGF